MKKKFFLCLLFIIHQTVFAAPPNAAQTGTFQYIQNRGQWQNAILYAADIYGGKIFLEKNGFTWYFTNISEFTNHVQKTDAQELKNKKFKTHAFKTNFVGANENVIADGENKFSNYYNYFIGNNSATWKGNIPAFEGVKYNGLYPGIDLNVYSNYNNVKYDFIVSAGANASQIKIQYDGLNSMYLDADENLILETSLNKIKELKPTAYQIINGQKKYIECNFILSDNQITFSLGNYDVSSQLIIDPATLIFATYTGSTSDNWGYSASYDDIGNAYGAGIVFGIGYPTTTGAYQTDFGGGPGFFGCDISISKFSPDGTSLIFSTYLGGNGEDLPFSMVVDSANQLIVYGSTGSSDFPTSASAFDATFNGGLAVTIESVLNFSEGSDVYITKFNADGTGIIGSTYFGGTGNDGLNQGVTLTNYGDHSRGAIAVDEEGNSIVVSSTYSNDLPVTPGVFQTTKDADQDGFMAKLNYDLSEVTWCSYLGGNGNDGAYALKRAPDGNFLVCGGTSSTNFPTTAGALNTTYLGGTTDGFVARINPDASVILNATYIGTNQYDQTYLVETDEENNVFITGQTSGAYPVSAGVYSNPGSSQYLTKLNTGLSSIIYSTVFGTGSSTVNISPTALLVDDCDHVYIAGWGGSVNNTYFPLTGFTTGLPVTADAYQPTTDGSDFYFIVFDKDATGLNYATFFGGPISAEHVDGGTSRFNKTGIIYQAVCAGCGSNDDFPTTPGVWSNTNNSFNCNLGVMKFQFDFPGALALADAEPLAGCSPLTVNFINNSTGAVNYNWYFGDGAASSEEEPTHTYSAPGTYDVILIATDSNSCNINDSTSLNINVYGFPIASFTEMPNPTSIYDTADFTDLSTDAVSWLWDFGDGDSSALQNPSHNYTQTGRYMVCLTVQTENGCEDSICNPIDVFENSLLNIPNAFSPNGDGINDFYLPVNYGLDKMELFVYNRWGQLVFYTSDPKIGWDGTFNGKEQDMDTYVFVVSGVGKDGVKYYRQGNVTLIR